MTSMRRLITCAALACALVSSAASMSPAAESELEPKFAAPAIQEVVRLGALDLTARHIRPKGSGLATLVLVHDTLGAYDDPLVRRLQAALTDRGVATLAINLSLGESGRVAAFLCNRRHAHRHEDAIEEIDAWVDWLLGEGLGPVFLAGHGRGGAQIAWHLARRAKDRVAGAILLNPTGWTPRQADADYRARYAAGLSALLTQIAGRDPNDIVQNVPFLHCGAVEATQASIESYYGPEPLRDTPTALAEATAPTLALTAENAATSPEDDTVARLQALDNPQIVVREVAGADDQFSGPALNEAADAIDAYLRSILPR